MGRNVNTGRDGNWDFLYYFTDINTEMLIAALFVVGKKLENWVKE